MWRWIMWKAGGVKHLKDTMHNQKGKTTVWCANGLDSKQMAWPSKARKRKGEKRQTKRGRGYCRARTHIHAHTDRHTLQKISYEPAFTNNSSLLCNHQGHTHIQQTARQAQTSPSLLLYTCGKLHRSPWQSQQARLGMVFTTGWAGLYSGGDENENLSVFVWENALSQQWLWRWP